MKKSSQETIPPEWLAEQDTGIYRDPPKKFVPISSRLGAESKRLYDLDRQLTEAEKFARKVLALPDVKNRVFHNWRRRELYARQVLAHVQLVRQWRTEGDAEKGGAYSYWLGRYVEALRVSGIEHNAGRGRTTLRAARP